MKTSKLGILPKKLYLDQKAPFIIYDAAAGSGKTFTLVKEYLKIILQATNLGYYKYILAITFTNKAVAEMKQRIITNLSSFSKDDIKNNPTDMATIIAEETGLNLDQIHAHSNKALKHLLHNYSSFSVETIDSFNHRLIRAFSRDLKLTGNFEVSLDTPKLVHEAVDLLISKAGENKKTTQILLDFALEKTDDDKSWDISRDIIKTAGLLFNENDSLHINKLRKKSLDDFLLFKKQLKNKKNSLVKEISAKSMEVLRKISSESLHPEDFTRKTLYNHFNNISEKNYNVYQNKLLENLEEGGFALYKKTTPQDIALKIDRLTPYLLEQYIILKATVFNLQLTDSMLKNSTPLSVINLVSQEIETIKEEQNIVPISEFNHLINNEIKNQPAPFIYERLGERYRHFFIDEFQDTSFLQWQNLIPLIDNSISQQYHDGTQGSLLLVGDAKQSIYRWRGGLPEQFIGLCNGVNPFHIKEIVEHLPTNYRSCEEIVSFNNSFFTYISSYFGDPLHKKLYKSGNQQKSTNNKGGYIKIEFLDFQNKEESHEVYAKKVHQAISQIKNNGFQEKDICILTRTKNQGISLGSYLIEQGITIVSSETLLLQHSPIVLFLVNCLTISLFSENEEVKIKLLEFLYQHLSVSEEKHSFFKSFIKSSLPAFSENLKAYGIDIDFNKIQSLSLYDSFEYCIRKFNLSDLADAYLFGFMDLVYDFEQLAKAGKISFLEDWDTQKEKAGIPISEGVEGVKIITIHKAKGLEFPIVIFPYADIDIYKEIEPKTWFPINDPTIDFDETLINFNKKVEEFGEVGKTIYDQRRNTLELDNINLLYVTLTRAEKQLFVFTKKPSKLTDHLTTYNQLFAQYLNHSGDWDEDKETYEFGSIQLNDRKKEITGIKTIAPHFITNSSQKLNLKIVSADMNLGDFENEKKDFGLLFHKAMEGVKSKDDIISVFKKIDDTIDISFEMKLSIKKGINSIITHPRLIRLFDSNEKVENERKIIIPKSEGDNLIADRINFHEDGSVTIIDYKTGRQKEEYKNKINLYGSAIKKMGYPVSEKILIYTKFDPIELIYV